MPPVDTTNRQQVIDFYSNYYLPSNGVAPGWTGSLVTGNPGTLSAAYRTATVQRINYYRAMCGLTNIVFGAVEDGKCQQAALMMAAQNDISHDPPPTWRFYTADAADACANSDIRLDGAGDEGPGAVDRFIADDEVNNSFAGHRRWLIYPGEGEMGSGTVPSSDTNPGTAAIWIMNTVPRPAGTPDSVSWPCSGYVPANLLYRRWSFSFKDADFSQTSVTVIKNGASISVTQETPQFQSENVGDNTLVWELPGNTVDPANDETYAVHLDNVIIAGAPRSFDYTVTTVDVNPPAEIDLLLTVPTAHRTGPQKGKIRLTRSGDVSAPLTVAYQAGGTATPGERYAPLSGQVTFGAGSAVAKIAVVPTSTPGLHGKRTVTITLLPGDAYTLGAVTGATILITK